MKKTLLFTLALSLSFALACKPKQDDHAGHDHDHDHEHGDHSHDDHNHAGDHAHEPKFGGTPIELGEHQYHMEFLRDGKEGVMKAWTLDGHLENFVRVKTEAFELTARVGDEDKKLTFFATANSATGETVGDTSYFKARADWLKTAENFDVSIPTINIRGTEFKDVSFNYPKGMVGDADDKK